MLDNEYFQLMEKLDRLSRCDPRWVFQALASVRKENGQDYVNHIVRYQPLAATDEEEVFWHILKYIAKDINKLTTDPTKEVFRRCINGISELFTKEKTKDWQHRVFLRFIAFVNELMITIHQYENEEKKVAQQKLDQVIVEGLNAVSAALKKHRERSKSNPYRSDSVILQAIKSKKTSQQGALKQKATMQQQFTARQTVVNESEKAMESLTNQSHIDEPSLQQPDENEAILAIYQQLDEEEAELNESENLTWENKIEGGDERINRDWDIDYIGQALIEVSQHADDQHDYSGELACFDELLVSLENSSTATMAIVDDIVFIAQYLAETSQAAQAAKHFTDCINQLINIYHQSNEQDNLRGKEIFKLLFSDFIAKLKYNLRQSTSGKRRRDSRIIAEMTASLQESDQAIQAMIDEL